MCSFLTQVAQFSVDLIHISLEKPKIAWKGSLYIQDENCPSFRIGIEKVSRNGLRITIKTLPIRNPARMTTRKSPRLVSSLKKGSTAIVQLFTHTFLHKTQRMRTQSSIRDYSNGRRDA